MDRISPEPSGASGPCPVIITDIRHFFSYCSLPFGGPDPPTTLFGECVFVKTPNRMGKDNRNEPCGHRKEDASCVRKTVFTKVRIQSNKAGQPVVFERGQNSRFVHDLERCSKQSMDRVHSVGGSSDYVGKTWQFAHAGWTRSRRGRPAGYRDDVIRSVFFCKLQPVFDNRTVEFHAHVFNPKPSCIGLE